MGSVALAIAVALSGSASGEAPAPTPASPPPLSVAAPRQKSFLVRPYFGISSLDFHLDTPDAKRSLQYMPNNRPFIGLKLGYKGLTISGSIDIPGDDVDAQRGKTDYLDLQIGKGFRLGGRELFVGGFFQVYQGFYLDNTAAVDPAASGYLVRPDVWALTFGASGTYYLNREFSHEGTFSEMRPRAGSGGSWLLRSTIGVLGFESDDEVRLIPDTVQADYGDAAGMYTMTSAFITAQGGYAYDWRIWRQLLLAGELAGGVTLGSQTYRLEGGADTDEGSIGLAGALHVALGYGGETFHGGVSLGMEYENVSARRLDMTFFRFILLMAAGARF
jgi:hypothetical protein